MTTMHYVYFGIFFFFLNRYTLTLCIHSSLAKIERLTYLKNFKILHMNMNASQGAVNPNP